MANEIAKGEIETAWFSIFFGRKEDESKGLKSLIKIFRGKIFKYLFIHPSPSIVRKVEYDPIKFRYNTVLYFCRKYSIQFDPKSDSRQKKIDQIFDNKYCFNKLRIR